MKSPTLKTYLRSEAVRDGRLALNYPWQPRVQCDRSDPVGDSRVLLFILKSFGEPNPEATNKLRDSGGRVTTEIRQKCV